MLCLLRQSRKGELEAGATSGYISASLVTLSTSNSGSLYLMIAKLKMSLRIFAIPVNKTNQDEMKLKARLNLSEGRQIIASSRPHQLRVAFTL
jgi:hypothetical protein